MLACLAKSPDDRPASAEDLAARLRAIEGLKPWTAERRWQWWEQHEPTVTAARTGS